jgi:hypothetical protein
MNTEIQKPDWANWQSENPPMAKQTDDCELLFSKVMREMLEQGIDPAAIMRGCLMAYTDLTLNAQPEGLPFTDRMMGEHARAMRNAFTERMAAEYARAIRNALSCTDTLISFDIFRRD